MKKQTTLIIILFISLFTLSCSDDSVSDEFDDANGDVQEKLIASISVSSAQDSQDNNTITFLYTSDGYLNTISDGTETTVFIYDDSNELSNITGENENLNIEELYESPYDAFETGDVIEYDDNGNPKKIEFLEEEYDYQSNTSFTKTYTAEVAYDNVHNPFFYTLKAGGIIDVLDNVQLNFSANPQAPEIVQARLLFPVNNISQIIYKNEEGEIVYTINVNYVYDDENYPTSATVTAISTEYSEQNAYSVVFEYVD